MEWWIVQEIQQLQSVESKRKHEWLATVLNKGIYGRRSMANVKAEMHAQQK